MSDDFEHSGSRNCYTTFPPLGTVCEYANCLHPRNCRVVGYVIRMNDEGTNLYCEVIYENRADVEGVCLWELRPLGV